MPANITGNCTCRQFSWHVWVEPGTHNNQYFMSESKTNKQTKKSCFLMTQRSPSHLLRSLEWTISRLIVSPAQRSHEEGGSVLAGRCGLCFTAERLISAKWKTCISPSLGLRNPVHTAVSSFINEQASGCM